MLAAGVGATSAHTINRLRTGMHIQSSRQGQPLRAVSLQTGITLSV